MRFITAQPRRGAAEFTGYATAADPPSAIGDRLAAWQGGRAGARGALERRLKGFLEGSWKAPERLLEDSWKALRNILRKAPRGGSGRLLSGASGRGFRGSGCGY